jgi:hypothetical protein
MRLDVERLGTVLVVLATIAVLASVGVYGALRLAVDDLHAQAAIARAEQPQPTRSRLGQQLSAAFAGDLTPENLPGLDARGQQLDHRADRLLELTAVLALAGMLVALLTGRPAIEVANRRAARKPLASTSNGTIVEH